MEIKLKDILSTVIQLFVASNQAEPIFQHQLSDQMDFSTPETLQFTQAVRREFRSKGVYNRYLHPTKKTHSPPKN